MIGVIGRTAATIGGIMSAGITAIIVGTTISRTSITAIRSTIAVQA